MKYLITILLFSLSLLQIGLAKEETDAESLIKAYIESRQDPNQKPLKYVTDEQLKNANPQKLLALLAIYDSNESYTVRRLALSFEFSIANIYPTSDIRQEVAKRFVRDFVDPNSNTSSHSYECLLSFTKDDFNESSREMLHNALSEKNPSGRIFKICGVADMKEELPRLKEFTIDEKEYMNDNPIIKKYYPWYITKGWSARLARARMGVKEEIIKCIELAETVENEHDRVEIMLPQIGYIRQPEAIEYLTRYFERNWQLPSEITSSSIGESYSKWVILDILATSLKNFPVKPATPVNGRQYTKEDLELCHKWILEQKEWQIVR